MAKDLSLVILVGNRTRNFCPISTIIETNEKRSGQVWLQDVESGSLFPGYARNIDDKHLEIFVMMSNLPMQSEIELVLNADQPTINTDSNIITPMQILKSDEHTIQVKKNNRLFTNFHFNDATRPYFMPLIGPYGSPVTREFPLKKIKDGSEDHIHHRSCWSAWGDVNGIDHWAEGLAAPQEVKDISVMNAGFALAHLQAKIQWLDKDGEKPMLDELRDIFIYNLMGSETIFDYRVKFTANYGDVKFGDTKEGGFVSIRVADSFRGTHGGRIENSNGMVSEAECWGKKAAWCDYSGQVNGKPVGITIMDHPDNPWYPTYWHVRDYGLMAVNPFGLSEFKHNKTMNGSYLLKDKEIMDLKFRLYIHAGNVQEAKVQDRYLDFISPPEIKFFG